MRNLLKPRWIFIVNTLPILILLFLSYGQYQIVKSLLVSETSILWIQFGAALLLLGILNFSFALYLEIRKKEIPLWYGISSLLAHIAFLYMYANYAENIIPSNIPRWMISENLFIYVGTFLMPTLAYSLLILVLKFTPEDKNHAAWKSFVVAVIVPVLWYIVSQVITPFWRVFDNKFGRHVAIVFAIAGTLIFLFFLIRSVYLLGLKKGEKWLKYQLIWKIPVSIIFPLLGLALNNGLIDSKATQYEEFIFGDYSSLWFYIIAVINGIFICLPNLQNKIYRLILFIARSLTFAYTLYFFLVFLPFLPLSIVAIIVFGAGFLMLTPLILFVIHVNELSKDYNYLKPNYGLKTLYAISTLAFMLLPLSITVNYVHHKRVLNQALEYIYNPDYSKTYHIDKKSLQKTMDEVTNHKKSNTDIIFGNHTPYLSSWFAWIVLDNMTLSDPKQYRIENVFFDKGWPENNYSFERQDSVVISNIKSNSRYDIKQQAWISQVDIELTNKNFNPWTAGYSTNFELPEGCYISDYYLYVGDKKEMGILAEKKAAMWVFQQIVDQNRDPGILYYTNGNKVAFKVFPFALAEVRKTGIEFIHKEPIKLIIDSNIVEMGHPGLQNTVALTESADKNVVYIPAAEKKKLPLVEMKPYYHFLIDVSNGKKEFVSQYIAMIDSVLKKGPISNESAKVSFVGTYTTSCSIDEDWKSILNGQHFEGGFFLDRAIKSIIVDAYKSKSQSYPVMVLLSNSSNSAIIDNSFVDYKCFYPESDLFFRLDYNGKLVPHSLLSNPMDDVFDSIPLNFKPLLRAYPNKQKPIAFLPDDDKPSIVLKNELFDVDQSLIKVKDWQSALSIQGKYLSQTLHPEIAEKEWLNMVKYSFISKIMNQFTSYIVVENEAQKAMLKKKQEEALSGNKNLDLSENVSRMSEPGMFLILVLFGIFIWFWKKRKTLNKTFLAGKSKFD